jgi:hypothetical protein
MSADWPPNFCRSRGNPLFRLSLFAGAEWRSWNATRDRPAETAGNSDARPQQAAPLSTGLFTTRIRAPVITGISGDCHTTVVDPTLEIGNAWRVMTQPSAGRCKPAAGVSGYVGGAAGLLNPPSGRAVKPVGQRRWSVGHIKFFIQQRSDFSTARHSVRILIHRNSELFL